MGFKTVTDLDADTTISLGGFNKKSMKDNPTSIEGYYLGKRKVPNAKSHTGYTYIYYFQTPKGNVAVWGKTDLDKQMGEITLGLMVRASFVKMVPSPKGNMYKFKVEYDPDQTIEVTTLSSGSTTSDETTDDTGTDDFSQSDDTEVDEDAAQLAALQAADNRKKVQDLLNKNKNKN